jgi:hypothetical protein
VCDQGIADKLGIPAAYLRRTREGNPALYDANVNGWLERDDRSFLVRCLRGSGGGAGVLLSRYRSPFTGASGADNPVVFAGFILANSETGCGAFLEDVSRARDRVVIA